MEEIDAKNKKRKVFSSCSRHDDENILSCQSWCHPNFSFLFTLLRQLMHNDDVYFYLFIPYTAPFTREGLMKHTLHTG